ncbi:ABC transporter substrate-binding protein [Actinoplanes sp. NEAU-A12]|uniref:ABC transporter substrate-binding protein n=1 Tax=Actinoplanes sandaracinus TaxID=3045177 RepID=A0ABT6WSS4_9ACTN|nr:ABC transporter substrate-binding protein [Actinoplanes sandaracinus]MDI6102695.1 ABC transporter substrate-binding protein [Actinoplanes sandaracinus]
MISTSAACFTSEPGPDHHGDRRLRVGLAGPPHRQLSPFSQDAWRGAQLGASETLVNIDQAGDVTPGLAESWSHVDATTVRLKLRGGVSFHDGTALTPAHAAHSLARAIAAKPVLRALVGVALTATAVGGDTLELRTARPDPVLLHRLASPQLVILAPKAYARDPGSPDPVGAGTGPYRFTSLQGTSAATLERNDDYWGGRPALAGVDVRFLPEGSARVGALRSGEVDVVNQVPIAQLPQLGDLRLIEVPLPRTISLYLVTAGGRTFADPGLRAAVRAAADQTMIAKGVFEGRADPAVGLFGPASVWAAGDRAAARATAPPPATPGDPSGRKITLATYPDKPELPEAASVLAATLTARGFVVETVVRDYLTIEPEVLAGRFDAVILSRSYLLDVNDPIAFLASDYSCAGSYNLARFCDPGFDSRLAVADGRTDLPSRHTAALALEAELVNRAVVVPLVHDRARLAAAAGVTGLATDPYERTLVTVRTSLR